MHVNRQVREAVALGLGATSLATVDSNRGKDLIDADLPAGLVSTGRDRVERWNKGTKGSPPEELRTIELTVTAIVQGTSETLDDDLDGLRVEIENAVDAALQGLAVEVKHTGGDMDLAADEEGARWYAFLIVSWEVQVVTAIGNPERALV